MNKKQTIPSLGKRICMSKKDVLKMISIKEGNFCPVCGEPIPPYKKFCSQAHELLFYNEEDFGFEDEEDFEDLVEILAIEEKKSKCF